MEGWKMLYVSQTEEKLVFKSQVSPDHDINGSVANYENILVQEEISQE